VLNYYAYMAHRQWRSTLIVDEAHNLLSMLVDDVAHNLWHHTYHYPHNIYTVTDLLAWMDKYVAECQGTPVKRDKLRKLHAMVVKDRERILVEQTTARYRGETRPLLRLRSVDNRGNPPLLWNPARVKKIVLLSATINKHDIYDLGLDDRRVLYIDTNSPIPPASRSVVYEPAAKMSHALLDEAVPLLAEKIEVLLDRHADSGVIHCTYAVAARLRSRLPSSRLIWHTREDKQRRYEEFRNDRTGRVLVACGMYEGIDLPHDLGRWQAITKIPYLSLGEAAVRHKLGLRPEWYQWEAAKGIIQASGRICRTPTDTGMTYILDRNWEMLYGKGSSLFPGWFREALR
jgi:Rad3-related DNA helicase